MIKMLEQLTELDKKRIHNFICTWGTTEDEFVGVDEYLRYWAKNNTKLYHMLGNQLMVSMPFEYEKENDEIREECCQEFIDHPFWRVFRHYLRENLPSPRKANGEEDWSCKWSCIDTFGDWGCLARNIFPMGYKTENKRTKGMLQLQKNMKFIKAMNKVYDADPEGMEKSLISIQKRDDNFADCFKDKTLDEWKQDFINKHSEILNDKKIHCTLTISIHPLDFLTMSDNGQGWESCMSWKNDGCYHQGTVEMMNSNCVFCCYLHNPSNPWNFSNENDAHQGEDWEWNNKKYRVLVYATKDIVVTGKSYPFHNDIISKKIVAEVHDAIVKNMNWTYSFGPERYLDMKWINGIKSMDRARVFARRHETVKHNLIIDTNAMYNDFVRDSDRNYWCYRNKVKHTKVINASGPAMCLCCQEPVTEYSDYCDDYFERFENVGKVVCIRCLPRVSCDCCDGVIAGKKIKLIDKHNSTKIMHYCQKCAKNMALKCHCCGGWYHRPSQVRKKGVVQLSTKVKSDAELDTGLWNDVAADYEYLEKYSDLSATGVFIPTCPNCISEGLKKGSIQSVVIQGYWSASYEYLFFTNRYDFTEEDFKKWRQNIAETPSSDEILIDF